MKYRLEKISTEILSGSTVVFISKVFEINRGVKIQKLKQWVKLQPGRSANLVLNNRTNVASVGSVFNDTRKVKVLSLPETIREKSTFRAKALRRELVVGVGEKHAWLSPTPTINSRRRAFARNVDFSFIVSGSERTLTLNNQSHLLPLNRFALQNHIYFFT